MLARAIRKGVAGAALSTAVQLATGGVLDGLLTGPPDEPAAAVTPSPSPSATPEHRSLYVPPAQRWGGRP